MRRTTARSYAGSTAYEGLRLEERTSSAVERAQPRAAARSCVALTVSSTSATVAASRGGGLPACGPAAAWAASLIGPDSGLTPHRSM